MGDVLFFFLRFQETPFEHNTHISEILHTLKLVNLTQHVKTNVPQMP